MCGLLRWCATVNRRIQCEFANFITVFTTADLTRTYIESQTTPRVTPPPYCTLKHSTGSRTAYHGIR